MKHRNLLHRMFESAVVAALPETGIAGHLPPKPKGRTVVIGAGKGAAHFARAFENLWDGPLTGLVVTRYGFGVETSRIEVCEAAHPVPDIAGINAAKRIMALVQNLTKDDLVIALITGGGSALLPAPPGWLTLSDEQALTEALLASGAPISAMNVIRKPFSAIKGGRLAKLAYPAPVHSLIVSDVPGDDPAEVASGPTIPSSARVADARSLIVSHQIKLTDRLRRYLDEDAVEAPQIADPVFRTHGWDLMASPRFSLNAASVVALAAGFIPVVLSDAIEGEARDIGGMHADIARYMHSYNQPFTRGTVLLSGGETTVHLQPGHGRGGPNGEFLLSLALRIDGLSGIEALAADTDGIDGSEQNAGAFVDGTSCARLRSLGLDPFGLLAANDSYSAFEALGDLFAPGPTGTNVSDFRAILVS